MNIYVGNLDWGLTEDELFGVFAEFGDVSSVKIMTDRDTGRSRGFGFVEMVNDEEGREAMKALNSADINGRPLRVDEARPREERGGGGGGNRGGGGGNRGGGGGYGGGGGGGGRRDRW